jgi:PAS domain S-box-containing protein
VSARRSGARAGTLIVRGGRIVYASEGVAALAGRAVDEIVGRPFEEFVVADERAELLDRYARRLRGEALPDRYELTLALPDGRRGRVEVHVEEDGADMLVHLRDAAAREVRRLRLEAVATLGAAIQAELAEERIHARVRDELLALGLSSSLARSEAEGLRVLWTTAPAGVPERFSELSGTRFDGYLAPWTPFTRKVWAEGWAFSDDWGLESARFLPEGLRDGYREIVRDTGSQKAILVRVDQRDAAECVLLVVGDWLQLEDAPALRLFGAQIAAALDAARTIADLSRRNADLAALNRVAELASDARDLDAFFARAAEVLRASAGCAGLAVFVREGSGALSRVYAGGLPAELAALSARLSPSGASARAAEQRVPQIVERADGDEPTLGFETVAWIPLVVRARAIGVLACGYRAGAEAVRARVGLLSSVAPHLAAAIEAGQLLSDLRRRVDELTAVLEVARVVSSSLDLEQVLGVGAEHLKDTLAADGCSILLDDVRGRDLRRAASRGHPVGPERVPLDVPSLPREALDARAPVTGRCLEGPNPAATVLAVPLYVRSEPVGVALVRGSALGRVFTAGELTRASAIASQLAVAVDNARLYSETVRRAEELGLLHEVGRSLVATLDIARILDAGVRNIARIVDAPDAYLAFPTRDGAQLRIAAVAGAHPEHLGRTLPLDPPDGSLPTLVFSRREPIVIEDGLVDPRVNPALRSETGGRGYLGLPLVVRDRTIGALLIVEPRGPRLFTPAEVERAAGIANQLAVAVENARLYEDLRRSYADLERAQQQLVQRERLAALGELSAIVAHEVRNPLGVIFNSLGSLRRLLRPAGDARVLLEIVGEEAERLNRIVGDLLDFARPSTAELRPEPLGALVEEAVGAALAARPAGVELARELDERLPAVAVDARLARQAVLNVAVNAVQAMPRGGRLTVRTRRDGDAAVLEIEDTGVGMASEVQERIFEPFFTTKASGTGLGLAVVKRIVEEHGGAVAVRSAPGIGTVFALRFPLAGPPVEKGPAIG